MLSWLSKKRQSNPTPKHEMPAWFDSTMLNDTLDQLQTAVAETSSLANKISNQLENRLQTTEKQLSTILFIITEGIIIADYQGVIQEWNTGAEIIFGYPKQYAVGKKIDEVIKGCSAADIKSRFCDLSYADTSNLHKIQLMHCKNAAGDDILVEISINTFPPLDPTSRPNMVAIVRDVTKQHETMEAQERERSMLSSVLNASTDIVIIKDGNGKWIRANKAACELYGFAAEADYLNRTNEEIAEDFPEFTESLASNKTTDDQAWKNHRTVRTEEIVTDRQGQRQYFDTLKTPVYKDAKTRDLLIISARNVTSLKEKREQITVAYKALNASTDIVVVTDSDGRIMFANKMFLIKYRFVDVRDVIGKRMSIVKSSKTPPETHAHMWKTIKNGQQWSGVVTNKDANGMEITVDSTIMPIVDSNLDTPYYICVQKSLDV